MEPITGAALALYIAYRVRKHLREKAGEAPAKAGEPIVATPKAFNREQRAMVAVATGVSPSGAIAWEWKTDAMAALRVRLERCSVQSVESLPGVKMYVTVPLRAVSAWQFLSEAIEKRSAIALAFTSLLQSADGLIAIADGDSMPDDIRASEYFANYPLPPPPPEPEVIDPKTANGTVTPSN